jgi:hypothetical protein
VRAQACETSVSARVSAVSFIGVETSACTLRTSMWTWRSRGAAGAVREDSVT